MGSIAITTTPSEADVRAGRQAPGDFPGAVGMHLTARANRSLSVEARKWVAVAMCLPVVLIALVMSIQGGWLVLPFAGLEVGLILFAFHWLRAGDSDCESVRLNGDEVVVERSHRGHASVQSFNLHWVQVIFVPPGIARRSLLALRSHGRIHRLGELMTDPERAAAASYLSLQIRRARAARA